MSAAWICATPDGKTAHDTEGEAELVAGELVKSKRAEVALVYRIEVDG